MKKVLKYKIAYWNSEAKIVDSDKMRLEKLLQQLGEIQLESIASLSSITNHDLVIIAAEKIPEESFSVWLKNIINRVDFENKIWTPALIFADTSFRELAGLIEWAADENWYFDIISTKHLDSLPMRVVNLLRIHAHLRELYNYEQRIGELEARVEKLSVEMQGSSDGN